MFERTYILGSWHDEIMPNNRKNSLTKILKGKIVNDSGKIKL